MSARNNKMHLSAEPQPPLMLASAPHRMISSSRNAITQRGPVIWLPKAHGALKLVDRLI